MVELDEIKAEISVDLLVVTRVGDAETPCVANLAKLKIDKVKTENSSIVERFSVAATVARCKTKYNFVFSIVGYGESLLFYIPISIHV